MDSTEIFEVYAPEDELLKLELDKHLSYLRRSMLVGTWYSREILPGTNWNQTIDESVESASIILLLISEHFLNSSYSGGLEMKRAIERHKLGEARVIPILLHPVDWPVEPFQHLQVLPSNGIPVTQWKEQDEAFLSIAKGLQSAITEINLSSLAKRAQSHPEESARQTEAIVFHKWLAGVMESKNEGVVPSKFDVKAIAEWLKLRKRKNHRTVLLLGARAGKLFQSDPFYETLKLYTSPSFSYLTRIQGFNECFRILNRSFSSSDIDVLLRYCLRDSALSKADLALAELIKQGYFDEIITTNIDDGLERALLKVGMRESNEFEVIVPRLGSSIINYEKKFSLRIVKVRGDLASREYQIGKFSYLNAGDESNGNFKRFLQHVLARDVLAIGIDPTWDEALLPFLLMGGPGTLWFVDEEDGGSLVSALLKKRDVRAVIGLEGSYDNFLMRLHTDFLKVDTAPETPISSESTRDLAERLQSVSKQVQAMSEKSISDVSTVDLTLVSKQLRDIRNEVNELRNAILNLSKIQVEQEVSE